MARFESRGDRSWWGADEHVIRVPQRRLYSTGRNDHNEVLMWLDDRSVPGLYCWGPSEFEDDGDTVIMLAIFSDPRAAMAFKMRWC